MPFSAAGQSATVKGTVTDNTGEPLMGAGIMVKGTSNGCITDLDGNFELKGVTYPVTLVASFIGLTEKEVTLENAAASPCKIVLESDQNYLNEVVVVGYGTQKKVNVTGAVGVVDGKELAMRPVNSAAQALQGADPSLLLTSGSGGIEGTEYSVTIRGSVSINSGSPLILIDGVEGSLSQVNPNDIESVSVLKDASACAIYGAKASAGVVLVNTKNGSSGEAKINYNGRVSLVGNTTSTDFITSGYDHVTLCNEFYEYFKGYGAWTFSDEQIEMMKERSVSEAHARKICEIYRLAMENGAPVVGIFDSAGAYIPDGVRVMAGYGKIMKAVSSASGIIPQIAIAAGNVSGAAAVICGMFDIVIKADDASLSVNPAFNTDARGMADMGVTAAKTADVASAISSARETLAYLPSNNCEGTPEEISADNVNRAVSIASDDAYEIIKAFADNGKFVELYADYAPETVGGFVSVGGVSVGVVATNKAVNGGRLTAASVRKAARLVSLFDSFNIPTVTLVDSVGIDTSVASEASPFAAELAKLAGAYASATAPMITVITGEAYGSVFTVLGSKALGADIVYALDSAKIAAMNASSAVAFLMNGQITAEVSREDLERQWNESVATPVEAAASGEIDDIIASDELRIRIAAAVSMLMAKSAGSASRKHLTMPM